MARGPVVNLTFTGDATDAVRATEKVETALEGMGRGADTADRKSRDLAGGVSHLGDKVGDTELRFQGLAGGFTGTADVMQGFKDGDLLGMTMGFADLAQFVGDFAGPVIAQVLTRMGILTAASGAQATATEAQTVAQYSLNTAFLANPIFLVVAAIVALTAAFIVAWHESETFRNIVTGAFDAVKGAAMAVWNWINDNWPLLLGILTGGIGLAIYWIVTRFDDIKRKASEVKDWLFDTAATIAGFIAAPYEHMFDVVKWAVENVVGFFSWMGDAVWGVIGPVADLFDSIISKVRWLLDNIGRVTGAVSGIAHAGGGFNPLNHLASGGIVTRPTIAMIGEGGEAEAVIPLSRLAAMRGGGGGVTYNIVVQSFDPQAAGRLVERAVLDVQRRNGGQFARTS